LCALRTSRAVALATVLWAFTSPAGAQQTDASDFPNRTIRILVGFTPGGAPDVTGRVLAQRLNEIWKQSVVVENRPGAGSAIAAQYVATSPPDGYTLMSITNAHAVAAAINPKLPYDASKDFAPIAMTSSAPNWVLVSPSLGVKTLAELIALAKSKPNQLNYPSAGVGSFMHFGSALFNEAMGIQAQHIPLRGIPEALTEVIAGRAHFAVSPIGAAVGLVRERTLVALAVTGRERLPDFPDVPTVAESGYPGFEKMTFTGLLAPARTPPAIVAKLNQTVNAILKEEAVMKRWAAFGVSPAYTTPEEFGKILDNEIAAFTAAARKAGITAQ
jgi:tripartite-type tricarboxylate transporter receptor subunit TctC